MSETRSVIQLELNELTPRLMFRFMEEGKLPNFARLFGESQVFTTDALEQGLNLNPWIQWVTVHAGVPFADHGVFLLGEGGKLPVPGVVDVVSDAGRSVVMCGSMNVRPRTPLRGVAIPDAWATDVGPFPEDLAPYFRFVQHHVAEHTNEGAAFGAADQLAFLRFMLTHGLSRETLAAIARQLLRERSGHFGWQRVAILDRLQWDLFRHACRRHRPALATFFSNAVAHLQHTRWRNLEPERFTLKPSGDEQEEFREAVLFGYQENDRLVGRCLDLADEHTTLVFCTALSQQPDLHWEDSGGKAFYRPHDFARFAAFAGITTPHHCSPIMSQEFWLEFDDEGDAEHAAVLLKGLRVDGRSAFHVDRRGTDVNAGCVIFDHVPDDARLVNAAGESAGFLELLYRSETIKSGVHHPDGMLWIRTPAREHAVHEAKVPLTAIAPTVLGLLGIAPPASMKAKPLL